MRIIVTEKWAWRAILWLPHVPLDDVDVLVVAVSDPRLSS